MGETVYFFECRECGYDSLEARRLTTADTAICPLCAGDTGRDVDLVFRPATTDDVKRIDDAKRRDGESAGSQPKSE